MIYSAINLSGHFLQFLKGPLSKQPCERLIVSPRRQIILEGPLHLLDSGKPVEMYLLLFDDMFVITRRKKGLGKKVSDARAGCGVRLFVTVRDCLSAVAYACESTFKMNFSKRFKQTPI